MPDIAAIVLAAGRSIRMGRPKLLLPWGAGTVIERVVNVLAQAGLQQIVVVTGAGAEQVQAALSTTSATCVLNPRFSEDQMSYSLAAGFAALPETAQAALIALGDQPQIEVEVTHQVLSAYRQTMAPLVIPSFHQRRGHPWIVRRELWTEITALGSDQTMRQVINRHAAEIHHVVVERDSILKDLDTPQDYEREKPPEN